MYVGDNLAKDFLFPNASGMVSVLYTGVGGMYLSKTAPLGGCPQYVIDDLDKLKIVLEEVENGKLLRLL